MADFGEHHPVRALEAKRDKLIAELAEVNRQIAEITLECRGVARIQRNETAAAKRARHKKSIENRAIRDDKIFTRFWNGEYKGAIAADFGLSVWSIERVAAKQMRRLAYASRPRHPTASEMLERLAAANDASESKTAATRQNTVDSGGGQG